VTTYITTHTSTEREPVAHGPASTVQRFTIAAVPSARHKVCATGYYTATVVRRADGSKRTTITSVATGNEITEERHTRLYPALKDALRRHEAWVAI
jgi:hypothetical protein